MSDKIEIKGKIEYKLKIYQCPDGSWRILSEDYINDWDDCKLRNLTIHELVNEIENLMLKTN